MSALFRVPLRDRVRDGRPLVAMVRMPLFGPRWIVVGSAGVLAFCCCLPHAHDWARSWAVYQSAMREAST